MDIFGGYISPNSNIIDFVTIASLGNALDFGDRTKMWISNRCRYNSQMWFVISRWILDSKCVVIQLIMSIAQTGNAVDFGDL